MTSKTHINTMEAVEISVAGGPEVLKPIQRDIPSPKSGEVLIKVAAAGVNRPDCLQRAGAYPPPPDASDLPGLEVAGEIVALGENVEGRYLGERVCALTAGGGYAQYCVAPAGNCLSVPDGYSMVEAAALPETFFTVWLNVFMRGGLHGGENFLVHGGSSGIGTTAIALAKAFGATVYTTAGNDEKCAYCKDLGADHVINYRDQDWVSEVARLSDGKGVDVILDMVAGPYIQGGIDSLSKDGRYLLLAFLGGPKADIDFRRVLTDRLSISGSTLRPQSIAAKDAIADQLRERVWPLLNSGKIIPHIFKVFDLKDAAKAHALMESSKHMGKIMLQVTEG